MSRPQPVIGPILPGRLRPAVVGLAVVAAISVTLLAVTVAGHTTGSRLDVDLGPLFYRPLGEHRALATALGHAADPITLTAAVLVFAGVALRRHRPDLTVLLTAAPLVAVAITEALKPLVGRRLGGGLAFPSGHASACFAVAFSTAPLFFEVAGTHAVLGAAAATLLVLAAALVAMCIVVAGDHYATDVVGAGGVALVVVVGIALVVDRVTASAQDVG